MRLTVTSHTFAPTPFSKLLYGDFIKLGYGLQVEAILSEMLFSRGYDIPDFTDLAKGAQEGDNWVAYCNADAAPCGCRASEAGCRASGLESRGIYAHNPLRTQN